MNDIGTIPGMRCVHGLSVYAETAHHRILVDTGQNAETWDNAGALGIDITAVDTVILSHGHYDHTGGVMSFAEKNSAAAIYLNEKAGGDYWNIRDGKTLAEGARYIGIDQSILRLPQTKLLRGDCVTEIGADGTNGGAAEIAVFGGVTGRHLWPEGNRILARRTKEGFVQDAFDHEQYVALRDEGKSVLIGGCAHNGLLNILDRYHELFGTYPNAVVSGFHMMKQGEYTEAETETIRRTAEELARLPILYFTGHCTGLPAYEIMKPVLGEQLYYFGSGEEIISR
jgi:7,8-dihydropterin-6-yl-methyl-4-(beta-D-ribofuranosyl)aminobenzene 5'-phosphate synthase